MKLAKYDAARRALELAKSTDEVQEIRETAKQMAAYARLAKDRQLELDAIEIQARSERRLGELITAQKESVGLNRGRAGAGRPNLGGAKAEPPKDSVPTLAEAGIDKKLSARSQKLAAVPEAQFEKQIDSWREREEHSERVNTSILKVGSKPSPRKSAPRVIHEEVEQFDEAPPMGRWTDDEESDLIREALRSVRQLIDRWPDGRSYSLLIHELNQIVRMLERIEGRRDVQVPA